jgi:GT2 family glycosyltransferase
MTLTYGFATREWDDWQECCRSWLRNAKDHHRISVAIGKDLMPAYQEIYEKTDGDAIAYLHDDLVCYEQDWDVRVLKQFDDPFVGIVGVAGALGHGHPDLYKVPYRLSNLARQSFLSNMVDAEKHGARFTGERDVAIVDGMALFIRRPILDKGKGWPVDKPYGYFLYAEWACCEARRQGYRIRLVGIKVQHLGGKSSGFISPKENYEAAHQYLYDNNHDVLPYRVKE